MTCETDFFVIGAPFIIAMDVTIDKPIIEMKKVENNTIKTTYYDNWLVSHVLPCNGTIIGKNYVTCKEIQEKMSENGMKVKRNELYACIKEKYGTSYKENTRVCGKPEKKILLDFYLLD